MKIIDFKKVGNVVRFYLGNDSDTEYHGDDWNDVPYEHNAGLVYDEYIIGYIDVAFNLDYIAFEPRDNRIRSSYSQNDFKTRRYPCITILDTDAFNQGHYIAHTKFYFNDSLEDLKKKVKSVKGAVLLELFK